ncbi:MAG TPA: GntR family transcriptional regulator [Solirubrobacterales bacterium]|jgi:DNA-binding FadR family transcriptional regulator|nr:GntR family transcriptional regulator [Solirubrobacterales bacterium]
MKSIDSAPSSSNSPEGARWSSPGVPGAAALGQFLPVQTRDHQLAERLVTAIALGEYVPGQRLPSERDLETIAGVSRKTARQALHRLEEEGYVTIRRGRSGGAYVLSSWGKSSRTMVSNILIPRWELFEDLFQLRRAVDSMVASKAALRSNENDIAAIRDGVRGYSEAEGRNASRQADLRLHSVIAAAARNSSLSDLSSRLRAEVTLGFNAVPWSEGIRQQAEVDHEEFLTSIAEHDPEHAAVVAVRHLKLTETALRDLRNRVADR